MKGLCHFCFNSNVDLTITKGKVWCDPCQERNLPWPLLKKEKKVSMEFSETALLTLPERTKHLNQVMADLAEINFAKMQRNERLSEPLIDRLDDT